MSDVREASSASGMTMSNVGFDMFAADPFYLVFVSIAVSSLMIVEDVPMVTDESHVVGFSPSCDWGFWKFVLKPRTPRLHNRCFWMAHDVSLTDLGRGFI